MSKSHDSLREFVKSRKGARAPETPHRYLFDRNEGLHLFHAQRTFDTLELIITYRGQRIAISEREIQERGAKWFEGMITLWARMVDKDKRVLVYGD